MGRAHHAVRTGVKSFHHPVVGDLSLTFEAQDIAADGLRITVYAAESGTPSQDALNPPRQLGSDYGSRRDSPYGRRERLAVSAGTPGPSGSDRTCRATASSAGLSPVRPQSSARQGRGCRHGSRGRDPSARMRANGRRCRRTIAGVGLGCQMAFFARTADRNEA